MTDCDTELQNCLGCENRPTFPIVMAFQPLVDVNSRRIYAYEALVRGLDGESAATVMAQITASDRYAFDQACRLKAIRTAAHLGLDRRLNINFMPNAILHPQACLRQTLAVARECAFPIDRITFEFTEDEPIADEDHLTAIIDIYHSYGFQIALDDLGSGFAGLPLLAKFQPDVIKIDRSLITAIDTDKRRRAVVAGLLRTAEILGLSVVAEGVERRDESAALQDMGVHRFQGYLFARPAIGRLIGDDEIAWPA
jgi:EAL domain-containing protein (putative c-di-GMP-specific phosphodiesterase class I)